MNTSTDQRRDKRKSPRWTDAEIAVMRELWASPVPIKLQLARLPGRALDSIKKAAQLGLPAKPRNYSPGWIQIEKILADRVPRTTLEISILVPISYEQTLSLMDDALQRRAVHIKEWRRAQSNGRPQKVYVLGAGRNAPPLPKLTAKERQERHFAKWDEVDLAIKRRHDFTRRVIKHRLSRTRDPLTAAFFGAGPAKAKPAKNEESSV